MFINLNNVQIQYYTTKPIHPLLFHYSSTKCWEGRGEIIQGGSPFSILADRRGAYLRGGWAVI